MKKDDAPKRAQAEVARLKKLIALMNQNDLVELELSAEGHVRLRRREAQTSGPNVTWPMPIAMPGAPPAAAPAASVTEAGRASETAPVGAREADLQELKSPIVGTFYISSSPDKEPFVSRGSVVGPETVICIIEAMKVMNEIRAEMSGEIVETLVKNGDAVEFGQPLFLVRPSK